MRRVISVLSVLTCSLVLTAGCGGDDSGSGSPGSGGSSDAQQAKVIEIEVTGSSVTPNGDRVEVGVGQPIELHVTADAPGEIHVHSDPEQELEYAQGESTLDLTPIEQPGTVDVESHTLEKTIVQLEVR
jgi:hypothetical protein